MRILPCPGPRSGRLRRSGTCPGPDCTPTLSAGGGAAQCEVADRYRPRPRPREAAPASAGPAGLCEGDRMEAIEINAGAWYLRALRADDRIDDRPALAAGGITDPEYVTRRGAEWA